MRFLGRLFQLIAIFLAGHTALALSEGTADFAKYKGRLHLFGLHSALVERECEGLREFSLNHAIRNQTPTANILAYSCKANLVSGKTAGEFAPYDTNTSMAFEKLVASPTIALLDVHGLMPKQIVDRVRQKPVDGVCYNSALVDSGVLSEDYRSAFIQNTDFFLGMFGVTNYDPATQRLAYGFLSRSPLVSFRKTWSVSKANVETVWARMNRDISTHFTPGSVLCIDLDPAKRVRGHVVERLGGHCLTFITPNLISESNIRHTHQFGSWPRAFRSHLDWLNQTQYVTFYYFQLRADQVRSGQWINNQLEAMTEVQREVFEIAKEHRRVFESLDTKGCAGGSYDIYSESCEKAPARLRLRRFWMTQLNERLSQNRFEKYWIRYRTERTELFHGAEEVAYQIFVEMIDAVKKLNIEVK